MNPATNKRKPGLAVFLRLYKCCFKWVLQRYRDADDEAAAEQALLRDLVGDFESTCAGLLLEEGGAGALVGRRGAELEQMVERLSLQRHLAALLPEMPAKCLTRQQRLPKGGSQPVRDAARVVEAMGRLFAPGNGSSGEGRDRALLSEQLGRSVLGGAPEDPSSLFHAVAQILRGQRAANDGRAGALLRSLVATVAQVRYEEPAQLERFRRLWEGPLRLGGMIRRQTATVEEWAGRMTAVSTHGDAMALDTLAYHYKLNVLLYTPASPEGPLALPVREEGGMYPGNGWIKVAHLPWLNGGRHYVPVWPANVGFTPALDRVRWEGFSAGLGG